MAVDKPVGPNTSLSEANDKSFARYPRQWLGTGVFALLIIALGAILFVENADRKVEAPAIFSTTIGAASNVYATQYKSLDFVVSYERWLGGIITRDNLQTLRTLLATQLTTRDNLGVASGERYGPGYFQALGVLDGFIDSAPPGLLPSESRVVLETRSVGPLNAFIYESRQPSAQIFAKGDAQVYSLFRDEISRLRHQDLIVWLTLVLIFLVVIFLAVSRVRNFRKFDIRIADEHRKIAEEYMARQQADEALEARIDKDRTDRRNQEWIDTAVNSTLLEMTGTVVPNEIVDVLMEGLGQTLEADFVLFYSFGKFQNSRLLNQWSRTTTTQIDLSRIREYESQMADLAKRLVQRSEVVAVDDSSLIDISRDPFPDLLPIAQEISRSWMLAPVGEAIHGWGYVWIGMTENVRVWSAKEIGFVKKLVDNSAQVLAHAWMIGQSMRIAEIDSKVNRLVELDKVKNDFIENMNHELRTPLTSIIGYMEVVMDDVDARVEPELVSSLTAVQRNAVRLQMLIENMMQISKTDFDILPIDISTVDIGHLLSDVISSLELTADECKIGVTLRLDSPAGDLIIDGDINQLEQVFVNLTHNAIKFTRSKGTVTIVARRAHAAGDFVEVKVIDTGIGIPPEDFPNMFKRFFRASTATQASIPGFGIGLSLVHSIVHEHHGTITFDSIVGKGTEFTVTLPARYVSIKAADEAI
jgi:signal transduction histidine kinase